MDLYALDRSLSRLAHQRVEINQHLLTDGVSGFLEVAEDLVLLFEAAEDQEDVEGYDGTFPLDEVGQPGQCPRDVLPPEGEVLPEPDGDGGRLELRQPGHQRQEAEDGGSVADEEAAEEGEDEGLGGGDFQSARRVREDREPRRVEDGGAQPLAQSEAAQLAQSRGPSLTLNGIHFQHIWCVHSHDVR